MRGPFALPAPPTIPGLGRGERLRRYLLGSWPGKILLALLAVYVLGVAGLAPRGLFTLDRILLWVYLCYFLFSFLRFLVNSLLWRIRTKLLFSYVFIAVVPLVLLATLFLLAGVLYTALVASHL